MTCCASTQFYSTVTTTLPSKQLNLINITSNKADAIPDELKSYTLERIEQRYPANEILSNERADQKAKQGAKLSQPEVPLTLRRAKSIISTFIDKYITLTQNTKILGKPWEILATLGPILRHLERVEAVVRFYLTTGHDFLGVYFHWLGLLQCTGLDEPLTDDIVSQYRKLSIK
ncbi:uncharacterized protein TNCV_1008611 [Trichonephila clavipes]|nr:uncharacterized protein TNCV_1008611 [Trichonephila clavipes]